MTNISILKNKYLTIKFIESLEKKTTETFLNYSNENYLFVLSVVLNSLESYFGPNELSDANLDKFILNSPKNKVLHYPILITPINDSKLEQCKHTGIKKLKNCIDFLF